MRLLFLAFVSMLALAAQDESVSAAIAALQRGDLPVAEQTLRARLKAAPDDAVALNVLGIVLDQQKKFTEADSVYRRATALDPRSPGLLNNYGNHLIATGRPKEARTVFLKVLAIDPGHANANVQLARIALEQKSPAEALRRLDALPQEAKRDPAVSLMLMQADFALHRDQEGGAILARLEAEPGADHEQIGMALAAAGQYEKAEEQFSRALEAAPGNFEILDNLGLAASHAGHDQRAREVLESAHRLRPDNVDVLYDLAAVNARLKDNDAALRLLVDAARIAPERADVLRLLARTTAEVGYFGDAVKAWDQYLKLVPNDDAARRERAFAMTAIGNDMKGGLAELREYVAKHRGDAVGYYELGVAESASNGPQAHASLDRAIALKPDLTAAHVARGFLYFREGNLRAALPDFEFAHRRDPENPVILDRLGQTYADMDRPAEAVPLLRRAAELSPRDSTILLHLARALTTMGQSEEAKAVFQRFREVGPNKSTLAHPPGLVDFLSLPPEEQMARYRAGVVRTVRSNPRNAEAQVRYLELLLGDGSFDEATSVARQIAALKPGPALIAEAAAALLNAEQYAAAKELLESAPAGSPDTALDLAIAVFHVSGAQAGLEQLDGIPEAQRSGDYYLARAEMLDAAKRPEEAFAMLRKALAASPKRSDLYRHAAMLLIRKRRAGEALQLLARGAAVLPDNPDILLLEAIARELSSETGQAERLLKTVEDRWPEWPDAWIADAMVRDLHGQYAEARSRLDTGMALGAKTAAAYYLLADTAMHAGRTEEARGAIAQASALAPGDAAVKALAGAIQSGGALPPGTAADVVQLLLQ